MDASTDSEDGIPIVRGGDMLADSRFATYSPAWSAIHLVRSRPQHIHQFTYFSRSEDVYQDTNSPEWGKSFYDVKRDFKNMVTTEEEIARAFTDKDFSPGRIAKHSADCQGVYTALGNCDHASHWAWDAMRDIPFLAEVYSSVTGFEITPRELKKIGERIWNMEVLLNVREGFTREDYHVPSVWLQHIDKPLKTALRGDLDARDWFGRLITQDYLYRMLDDYYDERGYDMKMGIPTREKLKELNLEEFVDVVTPYLK